MVKHCTDSSEWERRRGWIPDDSTIFQYGANKGYVKSDEGGSRRIVKNCLCTCWIVGVGQVVQRKRTTTVCLCDKS